LVLLCLIPHTRFPKELFPGMRHIWASGIGHLQILIASRIAANIYSE
jgi:hypothetical protein